ncbi:DUF2804 domain-containing protein [Thalassotalea fonticola]|uniref:DUF2804 domain-containing protein n=1 Tax=Thalassotalea fonticola TaxID=3065649 RepID=A0ABZ0GST7_9GAMM|nr:DUF2804 domain-containing protein [Colwelliaceae bacterium S1-1]
MDASNNRQPNCLMNSSGSPLFGQFDAPVEHLAVEQFCYFNSMDKPASKLSKYLSYKQFQFVSINTGKFIIGAAIADIRYLGSGFVYVFDRANNTMVEQSWLRPPGIGYKTSESPSNGQASIGSAANHIAITIAQGRWQLRINTDTISANLFFTSAANSLPLAMCSPTSYSGWTYTQKHNTLTVDGQLSINQQAQDLSQALAGYDFSAGFMRRETSWRWASINSHIGNSVFGLNLAAGVNETGSSENVFWLDGQRHYLPIVQFKFTRQRNSKLNTQPWHITSTPINGQPAQVDLTFTPINSREERLNLWLLKSNFRQYIGHYNGLVRDSAGNETIINNILGLSEDHFARW